MLNYMLMIYYVLNVILYITIPCKYKFNIHILKITGSQF